MAAPKRDGASGNRRWRRTDTRTRHHARRLGVEYLADQIHLEPHPEELMLRNRI